MSREYNEEEYGCDLCGATVMRVNRTPKIICFDCKRERVRKYAKEHRPKKKKQNVSTTREKNNQRG